MSKKILVIEDEKHIAEGIKLNLTMQGHEVLWAKNGLEGLSKWREFKPDIIILDLMLPAVDGLEVLKQIRQNDEKIPILILSAKSDVKDKVECLKSGVDDYLAKPFDLEEFLLRVDRLVQRSDWNFERPEAKSENLDGFEHREFKFKNNVINFELRTAKCMQGSIDLTEQEIKLLKLFILNIGKPLSRKKILQVGWGYSEDTSTRTVDNFMVRFRRYFEENPKDPQIFKSKRSVGYIFDPS